MSTLHVKQTGPILSISTEDFAFAVSAKPATHLALAMETMLKPHRPLVIEAMMIEGPLMPQTYRAIWLALKNAPTEEAE